MSIFLLLIDLAAFEFTWRDIVVGIVAIVLGLAGLIKAVKEIRAEGWTPFKEKWITPRLTRRRRLDTLIDSVGAMSLTLERVDAELRINGGSSLKDMVGRIDRKVERLQARVKHQDETAPIAIFELNAKAELTFANCSFRDMVNAEDRELMHRNYISRIHRNDKTRFIEELREAVDNKMPIDSTVQFRVDDTKFAPIRLCANPDVRPGGQLIGFFGTATKIMNA